MRDYYIMARFMILVVKAEEYARDRAGNCRANTAPCPESRA
jgi:hypothetical protein